MIAAAAPRLALDELERIIHKPAHWTLMQARDFGITPRPINYAFGGVNMDDMGSCLACGESAASGVAKEVEDMQIAIVGLLQAATDQVAQPFPVSGLLWEEA